MAKSDSESAKTTIAEAITAAVTTLKKETDYVRLEENLEILKAIGFRQCDVAVASLVKFVQNIEQRTLTDSSEAELAAALKDYRTPEALLAKAIETLVVFRYLRTADVLRTLIPLAKHTSERIRKKATNGLELISQYDIDVFYGTKDRPGIGPAPQLEILQELERFDDRALQQNLASIVTLLDSLLSPEMEGARWSYDAVQLLRGSTPAQAAIPEIRDRSIELLKRSYRLAKCVGPRIGILSSLTSATRTAGAKLRDEAREMFAQNALVILEFFAQLVPTEELPILQKIEHHSYWIHYHAVREDVRAAALRIRDAIAQNPEYEIYKTLIGFEGVFGDWDVPEKKADKPDDSELIRKAKAKEFAKAIEPANYDTWRARILKFAETESDDLATFPVFYDFLEAFAQAQPQLALQLLSQDSKQIDRFLIPVLRGLWVGTERPAVSELIRNWARDGVYLYASVKQFLANRELDIPLLKTLLKRAVGLSDAATLGQIISVATSNYAEYPSLISELMLPAIEKLTELSDANWIFDIWFRKEMKTVIGAIDDRGMDLILANLATLRKIDYHAERLLKVTAIKHPEKVFRFLFDRLHREEKHPSAAGQRFEAIPYELHELREPLAQIPAVAVRMVREQYDGDYSRLIHGGARLLKIVFADFPAPFCAELMALVKAGGEANIEFVLAILRNYEGEQFLHPIAKEIAKTIAPDGPYRGELAVALESTGVVRGEYGMAEAYDRKRAELASWLTDPDERVRQFAEWYSANLEAMSADQRTRADESIALRKFRYGEREADQG
jgi:hypothetical protein